MASEAPSRTQEVVAELQALARGPRAASPTAPPTPPNRPSVIDAALDDGPPTEPAVVEGAAEILRDAEAHAAALIRAAEARAAKVVEEAEARGAGLVADAQACAAQVAKDAGARGAQIVDAAEAGARQVAHQAAARAAEVLRDAEVRAAEVAGVGQERGAQLVVKAEARAAQVTAEADARATKAVEDAETLAAGLVEDAQARVAQRDAKPEVASPTAALAAVLARELKDPVASVVAFAMALQQQGSRIDASARDDLVARILDQARLAQRHVRRLVDLVRLRSGEVEPLLETLALDEIVARGTEAATEALEHHRLHVSIGDRVPALADAHLVERVLHELLANAAAHSPPGSMIRVNARAVAGDADDHAVVSVSDDGEGIADGDQARVFEEFYTCVPGGDGLGVGLAIARAGVELLGGSISLESRLGVGSTFSFTLPLAS